MDYLLAELDHTHRTVAAGELRGETAHTVALRRSLSVAIADVWQACTERDCVPRWFLPLSGDLRAGGTFALEGNAHGTITVCERPHLLEVTWESGESEPSLVQLELMSPEPESTDLALRHTVAEDAQWRQYGPGAVGVGWDVLLLALNLCLDGGSPDPDQFGPALMRASASAWGAAHEQSGVTTDTARGAAQRTADFYTPEAP